MDHKNIHYQETYKRIMEELIYLHSLERKVLTSLEYYLYRINEQLFQELDSQFKTQDELYNDISEDFVQGNNLQNYDVFLLGKFQAFKFIEGYITYLNERYKTQ